jgi:G3E family GTPase
MLKKPDKDLSLSDCPEGPKEIAFDHIALLNRVDRIEAELREEIRQKDERIATLEAELRMLRKRVAGMREGLLSLMDRREAPGRATEDRKAELLHELTRNGNRPIELASFEFGDGKLSKQQRKRLVAHLRQDPLFEVPERPARRKLFVHLAGKPPRPR